MRRILENRTFKFWLLIGLPLLAIGAAQLLLPGYYMRLVKLFGINVILVASLNLTNGFTGVFSLGHAGFMAIGAYISAMLTVSPQDKASMMPDLPAWLAGISLPLPVVLPLAGLGALAVAFVIGFPVLRFKGHYLSVATLGLLVIIKAVLENNGGYTNGPRGITGLPAYSGTLLILVVMVMTLYFLHRLTRSAWGRSMVAVRDDMTAAASLGVNPARSRLLAFCVSAFFAGVGGALWAHLMQVIAPQFFYFNQSFLLVETSIIGGMFSLSGAIIGSLIMTFVPEFLSALEGGMTLFSLTIPPLYGLAQLILSAALVALIILRPQGLMGYREYIVPALFDRKTYRAAFEKAGYRELAGLIKERMKPRAR